MGGEYQKEKVLTRGKDVYIGIDVHKEKWHVTARVDGEEVFHGSMLSEYQSLRKFLLRFKVCKIKIAYEAGPCGFGLYDKLSADEIETIVVLHLSFRWSRATRSKQTRGTVVNSPSS